MQVSSKKYVVDIWSDFVCPWCWIAKRRFENALREFPERDQVHINFRSYRLAADSAPEPMMGALRRKLGSLGSANSMMNSVTSSAELDGLNYRFDTMQFGDTNDAHVLVKAVDDLETKKKLVEALYYQSTTLGVSLFNRSSLSTLAAAVGVSDESLHRAWSSTALKSQVVEDERRAARFGSGVPLFVFNNAFSMSGAQPEAAFLEALNRMRAKALAAASAPSGQVCGIDGCDS